ncbi:protein of unknown function [Candidatus Methylocalor cossyra]|uniref:Uncharacterized protein n=1 Tax=Candidatus Methylocalor cossyra TaxID=3108543 RepID=A0ABM9NJ63_9GAMM
MGGLLFTGYGALEWRGEKKCARQVCHGQPPGQRADQKGSTLPIAAPQGGPLKVSFAQANCSGMNGYLPGGAETAYSPAVTDPIFPWSEAFSPPYGRGSAAAGAATGTCS